VQGAQELPEARARLRMDQPPVSVELLLGVGDEELGPGQHEHLQRRTDLAQMELGAQRAKPPNARAQDGHGLARARLVRQSRDPIERVLEHPRDGVIVLRGGDEHGISRGDAIPQGAHGRGDGLQIFVIEGDGGQIEDLQGTRRGKEFGGGAQRRRIIRVLAEAPRYP
jgi:hypothetical protein